MARDLIRLMQCLFMPAAHGCQDVLWRPNVDVYGTPDGWLVKFDLAGVRPEDLSVSVAGQRLTVRGRRRDCTLEQGHRYYRMEIAYSHFERSVELPTNLDPTRFSTEFDNGMLLVRLRTEGEK